MTPIFLPFPASYSPSAERRVYYTMTTTLTSRVWLRATP
jgi:hypothetical protein